MQRTSLESSSYTSSVGARSPDCDKALPQVSQALGRTRNVCRVRLFDLKMAWQAGQVLSRGWSLLKLQPGDGTCHRSCSNTSLPPAPPRPHLPATAAYLPTSLVMVSFKTKVYSVIYDFGV